MFLVAQVIDKKGEFRSSCQLTISYGKRHTWNALRYSYLNFGCANIMADGCLSVCDCVMSFGIFFSFNACLLCCLSVCVCMTELASCTTFCTMIDFTTGELHCQIYIYGNMPILGCPSCLSY
jgi:hypothetical protein